MAYNFTHVDRLFDLEGARNVRDLGGYKTQDGKTTAFKKLIRAAGLHKVTDKDIELLLKHNIKTIIDLRGKGEIEANPDPSMSGVKYYNVSIGSVDMNKSDLHGLNIAHISTFYILMAIYSKEKIKEVFDIILENADSGAVLFHCTAGKDRTGVIAALLLLLSNVAEPTVIEDYSLSYTYLKEIIERVRAESYPGMSEDFFLSSEEYIEIFLEHIKKTHKDVNGFFKDIGFTDQEIKKLASVLF